MMAEALDAETSRKSSGLSGDPALKTNWQPNLCSSGIILLKVSSICTLGRWLITTMVLPPSVLYAWESCTEDGQDLFQNQRASIAFCQAGIHAFHCVCDPSKGKQQDEMKVAPEPRKV